MKNNPKKIIIVSLNGIGNDGGVERVNYYLNEILKKKYDVKVFQKSKLSLGRLDILIQPLFMALRLCFVRNKFVISNSWHSSFYPADISIHHGTTLGFCKKIKVNFSLGARWISFLEKVSGKRAKNILCVSDNGKNELVELYKINGNKIQVLNNFVDESSFFVKKVEKKENCTTILFSGRLGYGKGVESILRLSNFIEKKDCPYDFQLCIATNNKAESEKFSGNKKTKILVGLNKEQMLDFYNGGDVLYFPTLYEGFSMATLEALSCGIPVVGSEYAIPKELEVFDFCKRVDNSESPETVCKVISDLTNNFSSKRDFIHNEILKGFGSHIYKEKLFAYVDLLLEDN